MGCAMITQVKKEKGFTLIELMITVMVIGILVGIAIPAYQDYIEEARRSQAQVKMLSLSQDLERFYNVRMTYTGFNIEPGDLIIPRGSLEPFYELEIVTASNGQSFEIISTPRGAQSRDECGALSVNSMGVRSHRGPSGGRCWK